MKRWLVFALVLGALVGYLVAATLRTSPAGARPPQPRPDAAPPASVGRCPGTRAGLAFYRASWTRWHRQTGASVATPTGRPRYCGHARRLATRWRHRSRAARARYELWLDRTYEKWRCVHEHEAAWTSNTGNGYYGGLQFDASFELAYGRRFVARWGHAHRWPVWAQLVVAERGWRDRGWSPWPNTSRRCGR